MKRRSRIVILGAGPAGLTLALNLLRRSDLQSEILVIEKNEGVGGLASSFEYSGLNFDYGSHRLHLATAKPILKDIQTLLGDDLLDRPRNGRIRLLGKFVKFPLHPLDFAVHLSPSFASGFAKDLLMKPLRKRPESYSTFAEALLDGLGETICRAFYFPYARKLWGLEPEEIAAVQAKRRVSANTIGKIVHKFLSLLPGFKREGTGRFYYPREGFGQISRSLAEEVLRMGGKILLSKSVSEITIDRGRPGRIVLSGGGGGKKNGVTEAVPVDFIFSTVPITVLVDLLRPEPAAAIREARSGLRYRSMILHYLVLGTDHFTPYDAHYFPEAEIMMSRLSEPKNYRNAQEPRGITGLCAEIPCTMGDALWSMPDDALVSKVIATLMDIGLPIRHPVRSAFVKKLPYAYPVYDLAFEERFKAVDSYLSTISSLVSLGRQGLFAHDNTHHTMEMAYRAAECVQSDLGWDGDRWNGYRQEFTGYVVED